jgi:hypothetical protein
MFLTLLIPSLKPTPPHYTRRAHTFRRRSVPVARRRRPTSSSLPMQRTVTCPNLSVRVESAVPRRPRNSRHVSFHITSPATLLSRSTTISQLSTRLSFSKLHSEEAPSSPDLSPRGSKTSLDTESSDEPFSSESDDSCSSHRSPHTGMRLPSMKRVFSMSRKMPTARSFWEDSDENEDSSLQSPKMRRTKTGNHFHYFVLCKF